MRLNLHQILLIAICTILTIIPFFWLKPGEMDLGGDSSRVYFYDPYNYFKYNLLYAIIPTGFNIEQPLILAAPFVALLILLKSVMQSPYLLITLFNSLQLVVAFLSIFGIVRELLSSERKKYGEAIFWAGIFTGIYYVFSPIMVRTAWDKAIVTHAQIFLNPLVFYLLLRFIKTNRVIYLFCILYITIIFSINFSWAAAPILFGFYPLAIIFILLYAKLTHIKYNYKSLLLCGILFIFLHLFHFVPLFVQILDQSGAAFARTFTSQDQFDVGLAYFTSIAPLVKVTENLLALPQMVPNLLPIKELFFIVPIFMLVGVWFSGSKKYTIDTRIGFLLLFAGYLILFYLITANVTQSGLELYKSFFKIPGFSMFRNYYGQWMFGFLFFLSLILGYAIFYILTKISNSNVRIILPSSLVLLVFLSALPFVRGDMINLVLNLGQKKEFKIPIIMDPNYEKTLEYIRSDASDAKYLTLPFSEGFQQQLAGTQGGMYQGPSTISLLTGHSDFIGYQVISPFNEVLLALVKNRKYDDIARLLSILNIRYIFYNSDDNIIAYWPDFPYQHVKNFFPQNQENYKKFVNALPFVKKQKYGDRYHIYQISSKYYLPTIYIPKKATYFTKELDAWGNLTSPFFAKEKGDDPRVVFVEKDKLVSSHVKIPDIVFQRINPTKYKIHVSGASEPYIIVLSHSYNKNWKMFVDPSDSKLDKITASHFGGDIKEGVHEYNFFDWEILRMLGMQPIADSTHFVANGYANGWVIGPHDVNRSEYTLVIEMVSQRYIYLSLFVSVVAFVVLCFLTFRTLAMRKK